jgi:hypothetical protein
MRPHHTEKKLGMVVRASRSRYSGKHKYDYQAKNEALFPKELEQKELKASCLSSTAP